MSNAFLLLAISKRIEPQLPDWWQIVRNLQKFQNLTDFSPILRLVAELYPFLSVGILISKMVCVFLKIHAADRLMVGF